MAAHRSRRYPNNDPDKGWSQLQGDPARKDFHQGGGGKIFRVATFLRYILGPVYMFFPFTNRPFRFLFVNIFPRSFRSLRDVLCFYKSFFSTSTLQQVFFCLVS